MEQKKNILIVDDEEDLLKLLAYRLKKAGYGVTAAKDGKEALSLAGNKPDLILLDLMLPDMDGYEVCKKIKANPNLREIPIIFFTVKDSVPDRIKGLNEGANDYITKPVDHRELLARIKSVLRLDEHYKEAALIDELTGFYNYNFFDKQFSLNFDIAERYGRIFSLVVIDIDDFKKVNDTYGHLCGNYVLKKISDKLKVILRKSDIITRYGGDEFAIILPEADNRQAEKVLKRLKKSLRLIKLNYKGKTIGSALSFGFATYSKDIKTKSAFFDLADKNMYKDKKRKTIEAGPNRRR